LNGPCNVLIVDRSEETREVLQTVLERRGLRTMTVGKAEKGLELARRLHPDLVVLDLELEDMPAEPFSNRSSASSHDQPQMILLGKMRGLGVRRPEGEIIRKPYHYGLLIRKIEELLERKGDPPARESRPCLRCSSFAEPTKAAASS
jgi:DNA-binding response OmpR family regulator